MNYEIPEKMKAWVLGNPGELTLEEKPVPEPKRAEVLIHVDAVAICATDLEIIKNGPPALIQGGLPFNKGFTPGHEYMGTIVKLGPGVDEYKVGDRVAVEIHAGCDSCERCREGMYTSCLNYGQNYEGHDKGHRANGFTTDGGFAEYCVVNESQVYKLGTNTTFEQGAMTEPVACCLHGIDLCSIRPGHQVVVIGGGMIGLLMLQLARLAGAAKVALLEPIESKREVGKELGADICIDPIHENVKAKLKEHGMTWVNTVIECVGRPATIAQAIEIAGPKAVVMMFGLTKPEEEIAIKPFEIFQKELELKASYINPLTQKRALDLIDSGRLDVSSMVAQVCGLEKLEEILANPEARAKGKYIISPEM